SLGLADERDDRSALMYAFTMPGDASVRTPTTDDVDGVGALYDGASSAGAGSASAGRSGCGQASVAGARARASDAWAALGLLVGAGAWLVARRRAGRVVLPLAALAAGLLGDARDARSAPAASVAAVSSADAVARVVGLSTRNVGGVFETTLELASTACRRAQGCPERAWAHAWGGTLGGISQRVGDQALPGVGDNVDVIFFADGDGVAGAATAAVVAAHR
ncbi:MAG TPA: hypothetical protein VE987_09505, partial [Polyangiaceae bacterium]|nr:hypothetical protein [Polyangiaceae bacterium]